MSLPNIEASRKALGERLAGRSGRVVVRDANGRIMLDARCPSLATRDPQYFTFIRSGTPAVVYVLDSSGDAVLRADACQVFPSWARGPVMNGQGLRLSLGRNS